MQVLSEVHVNSVRLQTPQLLSSMASGQSTIPLQRFSDGWQRPSLQRNAHSKRDTDLINYSFHSFVVP